MTVQTYLPPLPRLDRMTDAEWAWVAGLIEGEGCLYQGAHGWTLTVSMTDHDVVARLWGLTQVGSTHLYRARAWKPAYKTQMKWRVTRKADIAALAHGILPWLGARRSAKFREFLVWEATR